MICFSCLPDKKTLALTWDRNSYPTQIIEILELSLVQYALVVMDVTNAIVKVYVTEHNDIIKRHNNVITTRVGGGGRGW